MFILESFYKKTHSYNSDIKMTTLKEIHTEAIFLKD